MTREKKIEPEAAPRRAGAGPAGGIAGFLADIEPFFYQVPIIYVDVGAHRGDVFRALLASGQRTLEAHLVEPSPAVFAELQAAVAASGARGHIVCHNLALGGAPGRLTLREHGSMTQVIEPGGSGESRATAFEIESTTLDILSASFLEPRISLLKIDVEGYEPKVLAGAADLLARQAIDVIYIEAGMEPGGKQQTYYRDIEDLLRGHGYRLFRIYEQVHEWLTDSPLLRRVNLAFMSEAFVRRHPFRLSHDLVAMRKERDTLQLALQAEQTALREAENTLAAAQEAAENDAARIAELASQVERHETDLAAAQEAAENDAARIAELASQVERHETDLAAAREAASGKAAYIDARFAELATLTRLIESKDAEFATERKARASELKTLTRQFDLQKGEIAQLRGYALSLEKKHLGLLHSRTWRAMEPLRRLARTMNGRKSPGAFVPRFAGEKPPRGRG